jgi:hypothetical protein
MIELNLPKCRLRLEQREGKPYVYDDLRRKFVRLTPEEWVRQHFVRYLIDDLGYPQPLMQNEVALRLGETVKRCDTLLYDKALRPQMILEYKAPHVALTESVLQQIVRYNYVLRVPYLVLSNGLEHLLCRIDYEKMTYAFLSGFPPYDRLE